MDTNKTKQKETVQNENVNYIDVRLLTGRHERVYSIKGLSLVEVARLLRYRMRKTQGEFAEICGLSLQSYRFAEAYEMVSPAAEEKLMQFIEQHKEHLETNKLTN